MVVSFLKIILKSSAFTWYTVPVLKIELKDTPLNLEDVQAIAARDTLPSFI